MSTGFSPLVSSFTALPSTFGSVAPFQTAGASAQTLATLFPSMQIPLATTFATSAQSNFISPLTAVQAGPVIGNIPATSGLGAAQAFAPVTTSVANSPTKNIIRILTPQLQAALIGAYSANNDRVGNLNPQGIHANSGGRGLAAYVIPYAAEIKAAAAGIAQGATVTAGLPKRDRNPGALAPFLNFDGSTADSLLMAFMAYKNGTYNNGVFGQYDLPQIVRVWEARMGPLPPDIKQKASTVEVIGMSLVYNMVKAGRIGSNELVNQDGSSPLGLWPNTPRNNNAYLNAINAVRSGVMDQDLKKSVLGRQDTVGNIAAFQNANAQGLNRPETPVQTNNLSGGTNQGALAGLVALMAALLGSRR